MITLTQPFGPNEYIFIGNPEDIVNIKETAWWTEIEIKIDNYTTRIIGCLESKEKVKELIFQSKFLDKIKDE